MGGGEWRREGGEEVKQEGMRKRTLRGKTNRNSWKRKEIIRSMRQRKKRT
jgi:hypothetical protein